jgi:hypothetical protein
MASIKQIEANRRNSQLSTGLSQAGKAVTRMNAFETGIDAQSQIIPGEDPAALELLTSQYYERFQPQGPEEVAVIDSAISSDWLLRRFRKTEAQIWNRSIARDVENQRKWGNKPEKYPLAAAFLDTQKALERLQRRISAAERSLRASLETFARLRKQGVGQALPLGNVGQSLPPGNVDHSFSPGNTSNVGQTLSSGNDLNEPLPPDNVGQAPRFAGPSRIPPGKSEPSSEPPVTPSKETPIAEIGFDPQIFPDAVGPTPEPSSGGAPV